jgi:hypothetical protein
VAAEDDTNANQRWRFYLGGFSPTVDSEFTINGDIGTPPPLNPEDLLGMEDGKTVAWGGVDWNIAKRHSLELEYFQLDRDGARGFNDENIEIGDYIVESGAITSTSSMKLGRVTYGYHLLERERSEIQINGGLHIADFSVAFQMLGNVCDISVGEAPPCPLISSPVAESESVTAPLPHIGGSYMYNFTNDLAFRFQVIGFAIELDSIDGSILELDADLEWQPWDHVGLGLAVRYFKINFNSKGADLNAELDYEYFGPALYVSASF